MDDIEKEPGEPTGDETSPENLPQIVEQPTQEAGEGSTEFAESPEMAAIRERVEQGEELTVELYTAYQLAGENVVKSLPDNERNLANLYMQLDCAKLLAAGGLKNEAYTAVVELISDLPDTGFYALFAIRAHGVAETLYKELTTTSGRVNLEGSKGTIDFDSEVPITVDGYDFTVKATEVDDLGNATLCLFIPGKRYARKTVTISRQGNIFNNESLRFKTVLPDFDKTDNEPVFHSSDVEIAQQLIEALRKTGA